MNQILLVEYIITNTYHIQQCARNIFWSDFGMNRHSILNGQTHLVFSNIIIIMWLGGVVVRTLDLRPLRRWVESRS